MAAEPMRIQRALAQAGVASRRAAERLVADGRVMVNGSTATIGQIVADSDEVRVDGKRIAAAEQLVTYLLNKVAGTVATATDPQGRPTVLDEMPRTARLYPVGRLDIDTTGALLISNDGDLAHRLAHPRYHVAKRYEVLFAGRISAASLRRLRDGIELEDGRTAPARVEAMQRLHPGATWIQIELREGRNRQIRRMGEAVGHRVLRLHRSAYAGLTLRGIRPGRWRLLTRVELGKLATRVGLER